MQLSEQGYVHRVRVKETGSDANAALATCTMHTLAPMPCTMPDDDRFRAGSPPPFPRGPAFALSQAALPRR
jgi:hypothetical protein